MADSWLFIKGGTSVRILRTGPMSFEVLGPGTARKRHAFSVDDQLVSFLHQTGQQLTDFGYRPRGYGFERRSKARVPAGSDRRRA